MTLSMLNTNNQNKIRYYFLKIAFGNNFFLILPPNKKICPYPKSAAITLANALIHSHLDYCDSFYYIFCTKFYSSPARVQNSVYRIFTSISRCTCTYYFNSQIFALVTC